MSPPDGLLAALRGLGDGAGTYALADRAGVDRGRAWKHLRRLERDGVVHSVRSRQQGRHRRWGLTPPPWPEPMTEEASRVLLLLVDELGCTQEQVMALRGCSRSSASKYVMELRRRGLAERGWTEPAAGPPRVVWVATPFGRWLVWKEDKRRAEEEA